MNPGWQTSPPSPRSDSIPQVDEAPGNSEKHGSQIVEKALSGIDSLIVFKNTQGLSGRGTLVHVTRSMVVFEVYNPYSIVQLSEVLQEVDIIRGERVIYRGRAVVSSIVTTGLMTIVSIVLTDSWSDLSDLEPGPLLEAEAFKFIGDWDQGHRIEPAYQVAVSRLAGFLSEISRWIEEAEVAVVNAPGRDEEGRRAFRESVERPVGGKIATLMMEFEQEAARIAPEDETIHRAFAQREIHPYLLCAPFAHRTYTKPLGYAGDYEMVNMMLRESPDTGNGTYARIFHQLQVNVAAAEAHRNRIVLLERWLSDEVERAFDEQRLLNVLNVGCGPAVEVQRFIRQNELAGNAVFHLMDFNDTTLQYTRERIGEAQEASGKNPTVEFIEKSIDQLLKDVHAEDSGLLPVYDFVYCAGLFDYFPDHVCRNLLKLYWQWVKPGGLLVATNVHPDNPNRFGMEHLLEWYLIYRDEAAMKRIAPPGSNPHVALDETGVNVFLEVRKPG